MHSYTITQDDRNVYFMITRVVPSSKTCSTSVPAFFIHLLMFFACVTFTVNALADPQIVNPSAGSTLSGSAQSFTWNSDSANVERVWLYVGTSVGGRDIANSGDLGKDTEYDVIGIPVDGSPIHARFWYYSASRWFYVDSSYTAADLDVEVSTPTLNSPANNSKLAGASVDFKWSDNNTLVNYWWLYLGSTEGGKDIYDSGPTLRSQTSVTYDNLPADGSSVFARLWYRTAADGWKYVDSQYQTESEPESTLKILSNTIDNITNTSAVVSWSLNKLSTGQIEYGTSTDYGDLTTKDNRFLISHTQTLSELNPATAYYYRINSVDEQGNSVQETGSFTTKDSEPPPSSNALSWGNPQIAWSLADTQIGGNSDLVVSHTVRFPFSGELTSVRPFMVFVVGTEGSEDYYHKGDGGTFQITLETDDGSINHLPSGNALAVTNNVIGIPAMYDGSGPADAIVGGDSGDDDNFRNFKFRSPAQVKAGELYHLVFRNTTIDPRAHFVSVDNYISSRSDRSLNVPTKSPYDQAVLYKDRSNWRRRESQWAIGEYLFADGRVFGNGYMEVGSVSGPDRVAQYVSPSQSIRQTFKPNEDLAINSINVGAMHVQGTNSVDVKLKDASGNIVASTSLSGFPTGTPSGNNRGDVSTSIAQFKGASIPATYLSKDQEYFLEVNSTGGTATVVGTRDGSIDYKFSSQSTVSGHAELRPEPMGEWIGWPVRDTNVQKNFDISFYFGLIEN